LVRPALLAPKRFSVEQKRLDASLDPVAPDSDRLARDHY